MLPPTGKPLHLLAPPHHSNTIALKHTFVLCASVFSTNICENWKSLRIVCVWRDLFLKAPYSALPWAKYDLFLGSVDICAIFVTIRHIIQQQQNHIKRIITTFTFTVVKQGKSLEEKNTAFYTSNIFRLNNVRFIFKGYTTKICCVKQ